MIAAQGVAFLAAGTFAQIDERRFIETMVQQLLVVGWIYFGLTLDWRRNSTWVVAVLTGITILGVNLALWAGDRFRIPFEGLASAKNSLAACSCVGIFLAVAMWLRFGQLIPKLASILLGLLGMASLVASGGRASGMVVMLCAMAFFGWYLFRQSRLGPVLVTSVLILAMTAIPFLYINLGRMSWFSGIDETFSNITHSIYSGRETIWPEVIDGIRDHPVIGNGTSASWRFVRSEHGITQELSAHNLYLSILYQSGMLGLFGFIALIFVFFRTMWSMSDSRHLQLSFAILVAVLFREAWEVSLTQNTLQIGLGSWILVTLGLSLTSTDDFMSDIDDETNVDDQSENLDLESEIVGTSEGPSDLATRTLT